MPATRRFGGDWQKHDIQGVFDRLRAAETAQRPEAGFGMPFVRAYAAAATGIASGVYTHIPLTQAGANFGLSIVSGDAAVTIAGLYQVNFGVCFAASAVNGGFADLKLNGAHMRQGSSCSFNGDPVRQSTGSCLALCVETDVVSLNAYQNTGGALAVQTGSVVTYLEMFLLGPTA